MANAPFLHTIKLDIENRRSGKHTIIKSSEKFLIKLLGRFQLLINLIYTLQYPPTKSTLPHNLQNRARSYKSQADCL